MTPPSVIVKIIWPCIFKKLKKVLIWTSIRHISTLFISFLFLVNLFSVKPLIKRSAVIENAVYYNFHPALMGLFYKLCKQKIACIKIFDISNSVYELCCFPIISNIFFQSIAPIFYNFTKMRINIIIILNIIFVVRRRYKHWVKINNLNSKILKIIEFIPDSL